MKIKFKNELDHVKETAGAVIVIGSMLGLASSMCVVTSKIMDKVLNLK